ncbi:MAG: cytochrome b6-f complex iron-sulfur subunit [Bacteroidia bacterium]|jgi:cytochrome b6-f complex iron-sulfur subunit
MERRKFLRSCGVAAIGAPVLATVLHSCGTVHYATFTAAGKKLTIPRTEFIRIKKDKEIPRQFVLVKSRVSSFPICLWKVDDNNFNASLMECTHTGCELNVGGTVFTCPCHGAEFSNSGKLLTGPAEEDLRTFKTETDDENIYIILA